jgi:predicted nucleic acid-binding protein
MTMPIPLTNDRLLIYLDANAVVAWMIPTLHNPSPPDQQNHIQAHQEMESFIKMASNHRATRPTLRVIMSRWALTEVHSVLYRDCLWANGVVPAQHIGDRKYDPRRQVPPDTMSLRQASSMLSVRMQDLAALTDLEIDNTPGEVWVTALRVGQECAIYAPDSLHLATALHAGCDILVTQDAHFFNSISHFLGSNVISLIQNDVFNGVQVAPLQVYPVFVSAGMTYPKQNICQYLVDQGFA